MTNDSGYFSAAQRIDPGTASTRITDQTCTTLGTAGHIDRRTVLGGYVRDWCSNGQATFGAITGKTMQLWYRPRGSTKWRELGTAKTGSGGNFTYTDYSTLNGTFKAVFAAQGYYLGSTSSSRTLS